MAELLWRRRTIRSAPSASASIPTTTTPSTAPTSPWSICERTPIETITPNGAADQRTGLRGRRHRLRHRLRRDDRGAAGDRHPRPRRRALRAEMGGRAAHLSRPDAVAGFPNLFMITGPGQPVGAEQHDRLDRAACGLDRRLPRPSAGARRRAIEATRRPRRPGWHM